MTNQTTKTGSNAGKQTNKPKSGGNSGRSAPVARGTSSVKRGPRISPKGDGGVIVANSEFVTDVADDGTIGALDLNPGLATFPWLCRTAQNYESYKFSKLVYRFTPTCSSATAGIIVMAVDYDSTDGPPADKQAISSYGGNVRGNVWNKLSLNVHPKPQPLWFFVSQDPNTINPPNTDIKLYNIGKMFYGVFNGATTGTVVGELSVDYEVEFRDPQTTSPLGPSAYIAGTITAGNTTSNIYANTPITSNADILLGVNRITFKTGGQYLLSTTFATMNGVGQSTPLDLRNIFNLSLTVNGTTTPLGWADTSGVSSLNATQASVSISGFITVNVPNGAYLTFAPTAAAIAMSTLWHYKTRIANYYNKLG